MRRNPYSQAVEEGKKNKIKDFLASGNAMGQTPPMPPTKPAKRPKPIHLNFKLTGEHADRLRLAARENIRSCSAHAKATLESALTSNTSEQ